MMTGEEKKMKQYLHSIKRKLNMPKKIKARVMADLVCSIDERREAGQTYDEIYAELGTSKQAATDLNEQMQEYTYVKSPWRWACLIPAVVSGMALLLGGCSSLLTFLLNKSINSSVGIIGGADGPTAIFIATSPDAILYEIGLLLLIFIAGILGFIFLSRRPRK